MRGLKILSCFFVLLGSLFLSSPSFAQSCLVQDPVDNHSRSLRDRLNSYNAGNALCSEIISVQTSNMLTLATPLVINNPNDGDSDGDGRNLTLQSEPTGRQVVIDAINLGDNDCVFKINDPQRKIFFDNILIYSKDLNKTLCDINGNGGMDFESRLMPGSTVTICQYHAGATWTDFCRMLRVPNPVCGDGTVDMGEACDPLANNPQAKCCNGSCAFVPTGTPCDDGDSSTSTDQCSDVLAPHICSGTFSYCGDGVLDAASGEECEYPSGSALSNPCCDYSVCRFKAENATCHLGPVTGGNSFADLLNQGTCSMHQCRPLVTITITGGSRIPPLQLHCGDGNLDTGEGEQCDDPNNPCCDNTQCRFKPRGTSCNLGREIAKRPCRESVMRGIDPSCEGEGSVISIPIIRGACDAAGQCGVPPAATGRCGDGTVNPGETCDDGNILPNDGCSATCTIESPPVMTPVCGNGVREGTGATAETCDDGNTTSGDGCSTLCVVENGYICDTARPNVCQRQASGGSTCGNGVMDSGETCDDHNTTNGDGCSLTCAVEPGFTCSGNPSVCTSGTLPPGTGGGGADTFHTPPADFSSGGGTGGCSLSTKEILEQNFFFAVFVLMGMLPLIYFRFRKKV